MKEILIFIAGAWFGILTTALMVSSSDADKKCHEILENETEQNKKIEEENKRKKELRDARD